MAYTAVLIDMNNNETLTTATHESKLVASAMAVAIHAEIYRQNALDDDAPLSEAMADVEEDINEGALMVTFI